jgi:serine/threonine protein kinase
MVAVKKLTMSSNQGLSEFLNEVVVISGLKHRNLVKLKGCCLGDGDQRMLVFEYVENKNLAQILSLSGTAY